MCLRPLLALDYAGKSYRPQRVHIRLPGVLYRGPNVHGYALPVRCSPCGKAAGAGAHKRHRFGGCGDDIRPFAASMPALRTTALCGGDWSWSQLPNSPGRNAGHWRHRPFAVRSGNLTTDYSHAVCIRREGALPPKLGHSSAHQPAHPPPQNTVLERKKPLAAALPGWRPMTTREGYRGAHEQRASCARDCLRSPDV
jgi:hypothetical protein